MEQKSVVVFASGSGTTFRSIVDYSKRKDSSYKVVCLVTDRNDCGAVKYAKDSAIDVMSYNNETPHKLKDMGIDMVVLAGFLKIVGDDLISLFDNQILNIHPSLLPAFGGKGYYGIRVHRAVIEYGAQYSGMTIHLVNLSIDNGPIVFQHCVAVSVNDTPETLQEKIHSLELEFYPKVLDSLLMNGYRVERRKVILNLQ